jgi:hypothetical protein
MTDCVMETVLERQCVKEKVGFMISLCSLCLCMYPCLQLLNKVADFHENWYGYYTIRGHHNSALFSLLEIGNNMVYPLNCEGV